MKGIEQNKYTEQAITSCPSNLDTGTNLSKQGHILTNPTAQFYQKTWRFTENLQKPPKSLDKKGSKPQKGAQLAQILTHQA